MARIRSANDEHAHKGDRIARRVRGGAGLTYARETVQNDVEVAAVFTLDADLHRQDGKGRRDHADRLDHETVCGRARACVLVCVRA